MGEMADWFLEQMADARCEFCGALADDPCDDDCDYRSWITDDEFEGDDDE